MFPSCHIRNQSTRGNIVAWNQLCTHIALGSLSCQTEQMYSDNSWEAQGAKARTILTVTATSIV